MKYVLVLILFLFCGCQKIESDSAKIRRLQIKHVDQKDEIFELRTQNLMLKIEKQRLRKQLETSIDMNLKLMNQLKKRI
jgi:hypothetical protein